MASFRNLPKGYEYRYPPASELSDSDILELSSQLSYIVKNKITMDQVRTKKKIAAYKKGIRSLAEGLDEQQDFLDELSTDSVTGLFTRNIFDNKLKTMTQSDLKETPFTAIVLDVNRLKKINDEHGHAAGDDYLATIGRAISSSLHQHDAAYRMGGDEFLLTPRLTPEEALAMMHRAKQPVPPNETEENLLVKAAGMITKRVHERFNSLWKDRYGISSGFSYGIATMNEPRAQSIIAEREKSMREKDGKEMSAADMVAAVCELADSRQYANKNLQKSMEHKHDVNTK